MKSHSKVDCSSSCTIPFFGNMKPDVEEEETGGSYFALLVTQFKEVGRRFVFLSILLKGKSQNGT